MPKIVSAREAKNRFGALVKWVTSNNDEVVVESHGEPKVVVVAYQEYERIKQLKDQARRQEALATMRRIRAETQQRNQDLTEEEADALADRFVRDVVDDMVREGKIVFEERS